MKRIDKSPTINAQFCKEAIDEIELIAMEMGYEFDENDHPVPVRRESDSGKWILIYSSNVWIRIPV